MVPSRSQRMTTRFYLTFRNFSVARSSSSLSVQSKFHFRTPVSSLASVQNLTLSVTTLLGSQTEHLHSRPGFHRKTHHINWQDNGYGPFATKTSPVTVTMKWGDHTKPLSLANGA